MEGARLRGGCLLCDNVIGGGSYRVNAPPTRQRKLSAMFLLALATVSHKPHLTKPHPNAQRFVSRFGSHADCIHLHISPLRGDSTERILRHIFVPTAARHAPWHASCRCSSAQS
jgi:hypothetical protein